MSRRTIEVSGFDATLTVKNRQVLLGRGKELAGQFPAEDVATLIIDTPNTTLTGSTMVEMVQSGGLIVLCGRDHLPAAFVIPVEGNQLLRQRMQTQLDATEPCRKRLWQSVVKQKILNQAVACTDPDAKRKIHSMAGRVRSGDPDNVEAQAARVYWAHFLPGENFRRSRDGQSPNLFLNYGYIVLRAAVARALCAAGLMPAFGLHHDNRCNSFCLADDLVEPYRPWVDVAARETHRMGHTELNRETKKVLLGELYQPCRVGEFGSTLQAATDRTAATLVRRLAGEDVPLALPQMLEPEEAVPPERELDEEAATTATFRA